MHFDTIVAPITGSQPAAVGVVRLSGPESWRIASQIFDRWPAEPDSHRAIYGRFASGDDGFALPFEEGHSYTGEETVELSIHGALASIQALVEACIALGARSARPGEFTERAFLNGRMDLTQAEAVRDTVEAQTSLQLKAANELRSGALRAEIGRIRTELASLLTAVEASVDFSEEIGELDEASTRDRLSSVIQRIDLLLQTANASRILRQGYRIAIVGPPNAGKSSLLNALLGTERAIVTPIAGTTRDTIEEAVDFNGLPVVLVDTAGLRETADVVESLGVQRAEAAAARADEIWYVFDATVGWNESDASALQSLQQKDPTDQAEQWNMPNATVRTIANKADLEPSAECPATAIHVSALSMAGLEELIRLTSVSALQAPENTPWIRQRHEPLLTAAKLALEHASETLDNARPHDLLSVDFRLSLSTLGQITGETASEDMVEAIFRDFCVGK